MGFLAKHQNNGAILSSVIAAEMDIPHNFLSKILHRLGQAGLISTVRGRGGGVKLSRSASSIMLHDVVALFMHVDDFKHCILGIGDCKGNCGLHLRWRIISEQFERLLNDTTVDQIF